MTLTRPNLIKLLVPLFVFAATFLAVKLIDGSHERRPGRRSAEGIERGASPTRARPTRGSPLSRPPPGAARRAPRPYAALGDAYLQKARETFDPSYYARAESALREALRRDAARCRRADRDGRRSRTRATTSPPACASASGRTPPRPRPPSRSA